MMNSIMTVTSRWLMGFEGWLMPLATDGEVAYLSIKKNITSNKNNSHLKTVNFGMRQLMTKKGGLTFQSAAYTREPH